MTLKELHLVHLIPPQLEFDVMLGYSFMFDLVWCLQLLSLSTTTLETKETT